MSGLTPSQPSDSESYRRSRSNSWSEWSDPRDTPGRNETPTSAGVMSFGGALSEQPHSPPAAARGSGGGGICIPSFLQPLLGIDFVPYLPPHIIEEGENSISDFDSLPEDSPGVMDNVDDPFATSPERALDLNATLEEPVVSETMVTPKRRGTSSSLGAKFASAFKSKRRGSTPSPRQQTSLPDAEWMRKQHTLLLKHQKKLEAVQTESQAVQIRAAEIEARVSQIQQEAVKLQQALERSMTQLRQESHTLDATRDQLQSLDDQAVKAANCMEAAVAAIRKGTVRSRGSQKSSSVRKPQLNRNRSQTEDVSGTRTPLARATTPPPASERPVELAAQLPPLRTRANTEPRSLRHSSSSSFMRVGDLELPSMSEVFNDELDCESSISSSTHSTLPKHAVGDLFFIDQDIGLVLDRLFKLGLAVVTDESDRFTPTRDTQTHLAKYCKSAGSAGIEGWPFKPWNTPHGNQVLTWTGGVPHKGFGHDWPVVKARGIVQTSTRSLLTFLLDSEQVQKYNKMSQGRFTLLSLQSGVETTAQESDHGFAGEAKIMRSLNKPRMLPKTIEMLSLWYTCALKHAPDSFMIVNRSVWENGSATPQTSSNLIRSEMLLGVQLLRPCQGGAACELTTITHVYSPGVPEVLAKRMAPGSAAGLIREIQEQFRK